MSIDMRSDVINIAKKRRIRLGREASLRQFLHGVSPRLSLICDKHLRQLHCRISWYRRYRKSLHSGYCFMPFRAKWRTYHFRHAADYTPAAFRPLWHISHECMIICSACCRIAESYATWEHFRQLCCSREHIAGRSLRAFPISALRLAVFISAFIFLITGALIFISASSTFVFDLLEAVCSFATARRFTPLVFTSRATLFPCQASLMQPCVTGIRSSFMMRAFREEDFSANCFAISIIVAVKFSQ